MAQGTIKTLTDRGFGFIIPDEQVQGRNDLFFHRSDVQDTSFDQLQERQQVTFDVGRDERRGTPKAINVRPVSA